MRALILSLVGLIVAGDLMGADLPASVKPFVNKYCSDCHSSSTKEADLDLSALSTDLAQPESSRRWIQIHDRIEKEEMPPPTPVRNRCTDCEYRNFCGDVF